MSRPFTCLALLASALLSLPSAAAAPAPSREAWAEGLAWEPQPVRAPVRLEDVRSVAPWVPARTPEVEGGVEVGPERGAALWLSALEVVRVVERGGASAKGLRFVRVPAAGVEDAPSLHLEEKGIPARAGLWYLAEPIGSGSVWVVTAAAPTRIHVERPGLSEGALGGEATRAALLDWVDGRGQLPALVHRADLRAQLQRDAQLGEALLATAGDDAGLRRAVAAWRKASALRAWALHEPLRASAAMRVSEQRPPGSPLSWEEAAREYVRPAAGAGAWTVELEGPGVLSLEARALIRAGSDAGPSLEVQQERRVLGRVELPARAALPGDEGSALPRSRTPRALPSGEWVGVRQELRVLLAPGRHAYRVQWEGSPLLLRARVAQRRPELRELLSGVSTWEDWAKRSEEALGGQRSGMAGLLRQELGALRATPRPAPQGYEGLSTELRLLSRLHEAEAAPGGPQRGALGKEAARALGKHALPPTLLGWDLRLRLARLLLESGHVAAAHPVLAAAPAFPDSGWVAAQAAELVARLPLGDPLRSRELAALELAWRREPLSEEIRRRYREAWWQQSRWTAVVPVNGLQVGAQQWLDIQPPQESARAESGALWALGPGQTVKVSSRPSPGAQALLRAFVVPPAQGTAPLALHVGTQPLALPGVDPVEPVEVALPPGEHALRLEGPPSTRAFLSMAPAEGTAAPDVAYVRTHWPLAAASGGLRFRIPDPQLPAPVRVQLRATGDSRAPVTVRVHTDVGPSQRLVLRPAGTNASHLALDGSARPSAAAGSVVVMLPPLTREVRLVLEKGSAPVAASLAVRRDLHADVEAPGAQRAFAAPAQPVEELLSLSRQLVEQPQSAPFLLARAELLLALGEEGLARADLGRLTRLQEPLSAAETQQFKSLAAQLDSERGEVRFGEPISAPTLIAPAFPGLAGAQSPAVRALATAARERGAKAALATPSSGASTPGASPAERYLRARLQARAGEVDAAALQLVRLYRETGQPQVGLEALALFAQLPPTSPTWTEGGAPLGSALAAKLEGWADLPLVRRMRNSAGRWTQWERLRDAEQAAGRLEALQRGAPQERAELVRKALLAPPWPLEEARLLTAGRASVLELETGDTQRLGAQVQCSPALLESADVGAEGPPAPCNFTLRVDGRTELEQQVPAGASALLAAPLRAAGRHQLELLLAQEGTGRQAAVRFVTVAQGEEARALQAQQPLSLLRSRPGQPVVMTVLGPTALRISARAVSPRAGRELLLHSQPLSGIGGSAAATQPVRLGLPAELDSRVSGISEPVGSEGETLLLLPERGPHQVRLETADGEVLLHVDTGVARAPEAPRSERYTAAEPLSEPLPWPALPPPLALLPDSGASASPMRGLGMLSAELAARQESIEDEDQLGRPLRTGLELQLGWRQELVEERAWLRLTPELRIPSGGGAVLGGRTTLYFKRLPLDLRLQLQGALYGQRLEDVLRYRAQGRIAVDRWVRLGEDLSLIPSVGFTLETQQGGEGVDRERYDRNVAYLFGINHPRRLSPRLSLRWLPLQDHVGTLSAWAVSNADLRSADSLNSQLRWSALLGGPLHQARGTLGYDVSLRRPDEHRGEGYLRHGILAGVDWGFWKGRDGRLLLFAEDRFLVSGPFGRQNQFSVGLRWDWTGGRGLRDVVPYEEEFEELLAPRRPTR